MAGDAPGAGSRRVGDGTGRRRHAIVAALLVAVLASCGAGGGDREPAAARRWPGPADTGVPEGTVLTVVSGDLVVSTDGEVVEDKDVRGCIMVHASNVTIRRVRVSGCAGNPMVNVGYDRTGVLIEDCELDGGDLNAEAAAVGYGGYTIRRCDVHRSGTGLHMAGDVTAEGNWVHDLSEGPSSHNDSVLSNGGSRLVIRNNTLENPHSQTAAVALYGDFAPVADVVVEGNLLQGGGYCIYGGSVPGKPYADQAAGIRVTGNRFGRRYFPACGAFGPVSGFDPTRPGNVWSGNVWHDTGDPVSP